MITSILAAAESGGRVGFGFGFFPTLYRSIGIGVVRGIDTIVATTQEWRQGRAKGRAGQGKGRVND